MCLGSMQGRCDTSPAEQSFGQTQLWGCLPHASKFLLLTTETRTDNVKSTKKLLGLPGGLKLANKV